MYGKMLKRDIQRNKVISVILCLFITLASMLVAGAFSIMAQVTGAMDTFFAAAKPLHYMQMVTEDVDQRSIDAFADDNELVEAQQTLELLGIDNSNIYYGDQPEPYVDSAMENSFVTQSPSFDFLLDEDNQPVQVQPGQVAAPLYAMEAYDLKVGDRVRIKDGDFEMEFTVACFIRDSQMNPSLVSSKRFLISDEDYATLKEHIGVPEYIIEFLLTDPSKVGTFEADYLAAGLPSGIAITLSILELMNALTGGLPAIILILASLLLIVIALVCLRFTIMATLEEEYKQIGVMKAIGLMPKQIRRLYQAKYFLMAAASCLVGLLLSFPFSHMFTESVTLYMGEAARSLWDILLPLLGVLIVFGIIAIFCALVFRKMRKISVVAAMRGDSSGNKRERKAFPLHKSKLLNVNIVLGARDVVNRFRNYAMPIFVFLLCTFLIVVPVNFLSTLKSPEFVGYTGVGYSDLIINLRHSENVEQRYATLLETLEQDDDVAEYAGYVTANYKVENQDGAYENISIRSGDFTTFPVPYVSGHTPSSEREISLSLLNAQNLEKSVGDQVTIVAGGEVVMLTVCGIYQDLTNGGRTARALLLYEGETILWYDISLDLRAGVDKETKLREYSEAFVPAKVIDIDDYMNQTFASTIRQLEAVTWAIAGISIVLAMLITALFLKMLLAKDRGQIIIKKGLGFTSRHIRMQYITALVICLCSGLILGILAAATLGEGLVGLLMGSMGASQISFVVNPIVAYLVWPAVLLLTVIVTTIVVCSSIRKSKNYIVTE